jgi:hypothetical protein
MAVVRSVSLIAAVAAFFLAVVIRAADVTITSFECDSGLNVTAYDFEMDCYPHDGYCMMGQDVTLSGNMTLAGLSNSSVYSKLRIGPDYDVQQYNTYQAISWENNGGVAQELDLCYNTNSNNGACPSDGDYSFKAVYTLPSLGNMDWFLTGQKFIAELSIYGDSSARNLVGDCLAHVSTTVTNPTAQSNYYQIPSAAVVGSIAAGVAALLLCAICIGCSYKDNTEVAVKTRDAGDFRKMEDDDPVTRSRRWNYDYA